MLLNVLHNFDYFYLLAWGMTDTRKLIVKEINAACCTHMSPLIGYVFYIFTFNYHPKILILNSSAAKYIIFIKHGSSPSLDHLLFRCVAFHSWCNLTKGRCFARKTRNFIYKTNSKNCHAFDILYFPFIITAILCHIRLQILEFAMCRIK